MNSQSNIILSTNTGSSSDSLNSTNSSGTKYILWMLITTIAGLLIFSIIDVGLKKKYSISYSQTFQKALPNYLEEGSSFKTEELTLIQLFAPLDNTKFTLIFFTDPKIKIKNGESESSSLFEETKGFQLNRVNSTVYAESIIKYLSSLMDFKRGIKGEIKVTADNQPIEFFHFKEEKFYASGIFRFNDQEVLVTAFSPRKEIQSDLFIKVINDLRN